MDRIAGGLVLFLFRLGLLEIIDDLGAPGGGVLLFNVLKLLGDALDLQKWAHKVWGIVDFKPPALYEALTVDYSAKFLRDTKASYTNFFKKENSGIFEHLY